MDCYPLLLGDPFDLKEANVFFSNNCNCIVGDDEGATPGHIRRILGQFSDINKRAEEEFFASNQSKILVNVTMCFIIEFSLNLSIPIYS
jgi:hypothetical protein